MDSQPLSPLSCLPAGLLHNLLCWLSKQPSSARGIRASCRWLRQAFDSANTRLCLGGDQQPMPMGDSFVNWFVNEQWFPEPAGCEQGLKRLLQADGINNITLRPQASWILLTDVVRAGGSQLSARLHTLNLIHRDDIYDIQLALTVPSCTALQRLNLAHTSISSLWPLRTLRHLTDLDISHCSTITSFETLTACTQLTRLHAERCHRVGDITPILSCTNLQELCLQGIASVGSLTSLSCLQRLDLRDCCLSSLPGLACVGLTEILVSGNQMLCDVAALTVCTQLRHLCAGACTALADIRPLEACKELRQLDCSACSVEDLGPLQACKHLERLNAYGLRAAELQPLSHITALKHLSLGGCKGVSDLSPLSALTRLERLDGQGLSPELKDLSPLATCTALLTLLLTGCAGVRSVAPLSSLKRLTHLDLSGCIEVSSLEPLATCTALTTLVLHGCTDLASTLPSRQGLQVYAL